MHLRLSLLLLAACAKGPPDVIFITVDTLRVDHVGAYVKESPASTPKIDDLADDGVLYEDAWSPISVTGPAFATVHTGQEPGRHGVVMNMFRGGQALPDSATTLAELLQQQGYATGAFLSGYTLRRDLNLHQGFDAYDPPKDNRRAGLATAKRAIEWLEAQEGRVFLWYHSYDAHGPLRRWNEVPQQGQWERGDQSKLAKYQIIGNISDPSFYAQRYALAVQYADGAVGELISALKSEWRYRKALIVFTADHGESFTERELWFDHGTAASAEQLHVPLIVKYPGNKGDGERVGAQVGLADIAPTVLQLVEEGLSEEGVAVPEAWAALRKGMDGRSLRGTERRPLLGGESSHCKTEPALRCDPPGPMGKELAARDGEHAVVQAVTRDGVELRVYDRKADPAELKPLSAPAPAELASRVAEMQQLRAAMGLSAPEASADPNDEESQKLKELGYMD